MMKKTKILYLTPGCFDKGGISRYNRYQINALREIVGKDSVRVFSLLGPQEGDFESSFEVDWFGSGAYTYSKVNFIIRALLSCLFWRPDIILSAHVNFSGYAAFLSLFSNSKKVLNVYGLEVWSGLSKDAKYGLQKSDFIISDCHFTANYLSEHLNYPPEKITVIWDCVDLDLFKPQPEQWSILKTKYNLPDRDQNFIILTLGRIAFEAAHKGYERLIQVFSKLAPQYPEARLVFAGKGNMVDELKEKIEKLNLSDKVFFPGMIHDDDMAAIYSYGHVFSLVSDRGIGRGEGIPLTPLEAMACGTPIIVGNHDGSQESIIEGRKNGFVIDPFDLDMHQKIFGDLTRNEKLINEMSAEALKVARSYFSFKDFSKKHSQFLNTIIE